MRKNVSIWLLLLGIGISNAQPATGYYSAVDGKKGAAVKTALMGAIDGHTQRTYKQLWTDFRTTDCRPDGKVWDMYSSVTNYVFGTDQNTGSFKVEGDNYNREHSMPKSWFHDGYPMYTDLFHLYPTDSYINGMRSNYPFGEVGTVTKQSSGGFSKLGKSSVSGYSGTVFEPNDEYKGDFARTYFYMVTRYENNVAGWSSDMLGKNAYPAFTDWALGVLLKWHRQDPVSEKEINRNNAVYGIQKNRNPYIDYPVLAEFVWGELVDVVVDVERLELYSHTYDATTIGHLQSGASVVIGVYDLAGRRVEHASRGLYIVYYLLDDGSVVSRKAIYD